VPIWVPAFIALTTFGVAWSRFERWSKGAGLACIDPLRYELSAGDEWVAPAWERSLARLQSETLDIDAHEVTALREWAARVERLAFVAEVGEPEVVWPDGATLPVRLRVPAANVQSAGLFYLVSEDGIVLEGASELPHQAWGLPLPVLGPFEAVPVDLRPGDALVDRRLRASLAIVRSMWDHLGYDEVAALGRCYVNAGHEVAPDGLPGGAVIDLEGRRRILFGRAPSHDGWGAAPGELPTDIKWSHVSSALSHWETDDDWSLFDVRWDRMEAYSRADVERARATAQVADTRGARGGG